MELDLGQALVDAFVRVATPCLHVEGGKRVLCRLSAGVERACVSM